MDWDKVRTQRSVNNINTPKTTANNNSVNNSSDLWSRVKKQRKTEATYNSSIAGRINKNLNRFKNIYSNISSSANSNKWQSNTFYNTQQKRISDVIKEIDEYIYEINATENGTEFLDALNGIKKEYSSLQDYLSGKNEYYSQWKDEDSYNTAMAYAEAQKIYDKEQADKKNRYSAMTDDELEAEIKRLEDSKRGNKLTNFAMKYIGAPGVAGSSNLYAKADANQSHNDAVDYDISLIKKEKTNRKYKQIDELPGDVKSLVDEYTKLDSADDDDKLNQLVHNFSNALSGGMSGYVTDNSLDERKYEIQKQFESLGVDNWKELVEYNRIRYDAKKNEYLKEGYEETASEHPWLSSASTIALAPAKALGTIEMLDKALSDVDAPLNPNSPYFVVNDMVNTTRETVMDERDWHLNTGNETIDNIDIFDELYSTGMSMGDSVMAGVGLASGGGLALGLSAASDTAQEVAEKGGSASNAIATGLVAGINEMLWESVSLGRLNDLLTNGVAKRGFKGFVKETLKSMGINASEELNTEAANLLADYLINGGASAYSESVQNYLASGLSNAEAKDSAKKDMLVQMGRAGIGGALQGLFMGGGLGGLSTAATEIENKVHENIFYNQAGQNIIENNNVSQLVEQAQGLGNDKTLKGVGKLANEVSGINAEELDTKGNRRYAKQVGKLYKGVTEAQLNQIAKIQASETETNSFRELVKAELESAGVENADETADVIVKSALGGGKLTRAESNIYNSVNSRDIINKVLHSEQLATDEGSDFSQAKETYISTRDSAKPNVDRAIKREVLANSNYDISTDGRTTIEATGDEVDSMVIASLDGDDISLSVKVGDRNEIVSASELRLSEDYAVVLENIKSIKDNFSLDDSSANKLLGLWQGYDGSKSVLSMAIKYGAMYGQYDMKDVFEKSLYGKMIPEAIRNQIFDIGREYKQRIVSEQADLRYATADANPMDNGAFSITFEKGAEYRKLNKSQKAQVDMAQILAQYLGYNLEIFRSPKDALGNSLGENGMYIRKGTRKDEKTGDEINVSNTMRLDIDAGTITGKSLILFTQAHELTHFIKAWSLEGYEKFSNFLVSKYIQKGIPLDDLINNKIAESIRQVEAEKKKNIREGNPDKELTRHEFSRDEAFEEVVCDACQEFLADPKIQQELINLAKEDAGLAQKIKNFIKNLLNRLEKALRGLEAQGAEATYTSSLDVEDIRKLKEMWMEALEDAKANVENARVKAVEAQNVLGATSKYVGNNIQFDAETNSVAPKYSERTWSASEYVKEREATAQKIANALGIDVQEALRYIDDVNSVAKLIADDRVRLDYEPNIDSNASVVKPNSEYKYSVDMSTLCSKRLLYTGTFDAIQRALPNTVFDSEDLVELREMMRKKVLEIPCGICYVESTRREIGRITQDFIDSYKKAQKTGKPITRVNSSGKVVDLKKTKDQLKTTVDKSTDKFFAEEGYTPTLADLNTTDIDLVKRDHPLVYEAYLNFMNARGQAKPKLLETRAEYKGEILKHFASKSAVLARNIAGGLRLQSFSDFEVPHLIDMMQVIMDMSRVGLKSQAYTKVPAFAYAFGNTGVKINLSLIAKGDGIDADGNLIFDDVEGINHKEAFKIRDRFSKNVGTILVGKNDAHIIAAMADDRIDFIIPFHKSSWKESLYDALGLTGYDDYTNTQNEKPIDAGRKISNFAPSEYWDYSKSGDENAQIYLQKCKKDGRIPKFPQFQNYKGYWKLLIDFKMYDNDGVGSPQMPVKPTFENQNIKRILDEYKGGHRKLPVAQEVVDEFIKKKKVSGNNINFQDRDYSYNELVAKGDLTGVIVGKSVQVKMNNGIIDNAWVVKEVKKKCQTVSIKGGKTYYLDAPDIMRNVEIVNDGITHGFSRPNDRRNGKSTQKAIINARVSLAIPELLKNSIEVNRSKRGDNSDVPYTHVMVGTVGLEDNNGKVDYYAVRSMIQERENQNPILVDVNVLGTLTSVNAKKIDSPNVQVSKNAVTLAHGRVYGYNIADFLNDVKDIFDNTFSEDVYQHFGMQRKNDDFSKNLLFQDRVYSGSLTQERINDLIADSGAGSRVDYAREWIASINPSDFLDLTLSYETRKKGRDFFDAEVEGDHGSVMGDRDYIADLQGSNTIPVLYVNMDTGKVAMHNGRHRMRALEKLGASRTPVRIVFYNEDEMYKGNNKGERLETIENMRLISQFDDKFYRQHKAIIRDIIPLNEDHRAEIEKAYREKPFEVKYGWSIAYQDRDSTGRELSPEQVEFFKDSKVRDADGNLLTVYHGTNTNFTVFDKSKLSGNTKAITANLGFFFTNNIEQAKRFTKEPQTKITVNPYANARIMTNYLNITNPKVFESGEADSFEILRDEIVDYAIKYTRNWYLKVTNGESLRKMPPGVINEIVRSYVSKLEINGYDGIFVVDTQMDKTKAGETNTMYIAFNSNQIKDIDNLNPTENDDIRYQDRPVSDREILVDALSNIEELSIEDQNRLKIYKDKVDDITKLEKELADVGKQIHKIITTRGSDRKQLEGLYVKADNLRNQISKVDGKLLNIEAMEPIKKLVEIRKKQIIKVQKQKAQEQKKKNVEGRNKTATKNKIKRVIKTLESLYSNPTKEKNVKKEFQDMVAKSLVMADVIFNDGNISSTDILLGKITVRMSPKEAETLKKWKEVYKARQGYRDRLDALEASNKVNPKTHDELLDMISRCNNKLNRFAKELSDVVEAERGNRNNDVVQSAVDSLAKAYRSLKDSPESYASAAYNEYVDKRLTALQDSLEGVTPKNITQTQLDELYQAYKMVLTTVRTANDIFVKNKRMSVTDMGEAVIREVEKVAKITDDKSAETKHIRKFFWEELKPIYAFERIGSDTFTELYREVLRGQNIFASDVADSKRFFQEKSKKYNFNSWDFKDRKDFKLADGRIFTISLEEIMSIYAYSKRDQALDHMTDGGFVFEESELFTDNKKKGLKRFLKRERTTSEAYRLNNEVFYKIINSLTKEQKAFVDDMQDYLSTVMGAKGNEVSRVLYGIDLFKEKIYFPLITSQAFKQSPTEDAGEVSLKNWGATKPTKPHADNPIILRGFMDVWGEHVNKMSTYHSFVLPIENLNKVFNYTGYARQNKSVSVRTILAGAYGHEAANYIHNFIVDLNGGAKVQSSGGLPSQLVNKFKKTAVAASISVIVQQPTAVIRAMAMIDGKYFVHGTDGLKHNEAWEELKKYAPVAVLKEMGGFDVGSGKQVADFITAKSYEGIKEKTKGFFTDSSYRDEALMWGASKADEIGWITIWNAVKKEIADTTTYKKGSVEFLEACGERFTEVVAYTQVYDSVFSRSGFMRNKGEISKMATAFLGEATTSFNMLYNAILQGKRGNIRKGEVAKIIGATLTSIIAAAIAKSFIYALRDDDEDEAYVEKYTQALTGSLMDDLFIPNMLPYVKDLTSLLQGWEVERTDMAVIKDIKDAFDGLDSSSKSDYRKAEDLIGAIASVFGIPAKNLMRTGREIYNLFENLFDEDTLATSDVGGAAYEGVFGEITASDMNEQLEKGKTDKAKETMQKLISEKVESGKTEKEAKSALKASVTSYWKPIYLEAYRKGDTKEMYRIRMLLASLGLYDSTADTCSNWIKSGKDN